jgi:hypothetical protein
MKSKEQLKTSSHDNSRNINKDNEEISKSNNVKTNVERIDNNCNTDFSFQAPPPPEKKKKIFSNKNHSMSVINKKSSVKPLFRSPLNKKMSNETTEKKSQNKNDKIININNNNTKRKNKINSHNIKCKELFQETKLKFLRDNNDKNIALFKQKEKDKYLSKYSNRNENTQNNYKNYRLSTPVIKNRVIKKILNINKSREALKSPQLKKNKKSQGIETEKSISIKTKEISKKSSSLKDFNKRNLTNTEKKDLNKNRITTNINNFNKRAFSSNNYRNNKNENNINYDKINMKKMIKNAINNIFKDLPKEYEDNPVILYKFNSIIRNMKNIQNIIQNKTNNVCNNNIKYETKNNELEKKSNEII